jgi:tetratricopeptide (TPR) repeat protein
VKENPELDRLFADGIRLKRARKPAEAIVPLEKAASQFPDAAPLLWYLGSVYLHDLKEPAKALPHFRRAVELTPKSERASKGVFHSLWNLDRFDEALEEIKRYQLLTDGKSQEYSEIVAEINAKTDGRTQPKKAIKKRREKPV